MAQLMPPPLTVSCFSKIQIGFTFLVPADPGSPGKGPLKGCVCVCVAVAVHAWTAECNRVTYKYGAPRPQSTTFYSPNFPRVYPANIACVLYWFVGDANHIVQLRFLEFDLEVVAAAAASSSSSSLHSAGARSSRYERTHAVCIYLHYGCRSQ